jgi:hypothetical protein
MMILDRYNAYDDSLSSWAIWGGHISNPTGHTHGRRPHQQYDVEYMWHTHGRHVNQNQPSPFQWSIWAKPNKSSLFCLGLGLLLVNISIGPYSFFTSFFYFLQSIFYWAGPTCQFLIFALVPLVSSYFHTGPTCQVLFFHNLTTIKYQIRNNE